MRSPVSVVIPCYRCADTIGRAVESVIMQTLPPEEIILVEDCSNDGGRTAAALQQLQQSYQNKAVIKIIALPRNRGPGGARNAGWSEAGQPYVAFLDADDSWHACKLEVQYQWMAMHPAVTLTGHQSRQMENGRPPEELPGAPVARVIRGRALLLSNRFPARSVMLRRDNSYRFDPAKRYAEDYLLWLQIVLHGGQAVLLELPLAYSYKADFGGVGLSGNAWEMEKGELDTYTRIFREGLISWAAYIGCVMISLLKFLRRLAMLNFRRACTG